MRKTADDGMAGRFEAERAHLNGVAYRLLGSFSEADDAVQEAYLRLHRADTPTIDNLTGWLTTVVARVCLDMLRARKGRREETPDAQRSEPVASRTSGGDPEYENLLADSVGLALLVVLEALPPAERLAFVLHDMFALPFEDIAPLVGRSLAATRQLASRARRRVRGTGPGRSARQGVSPDERVLQKEVVGAYLAAARRGDFDALLAVLDPNVVLRAHHRHAETGAQATETVHGAASVVSRARAFGERARFSRLAWVEGEAGILMAPQGRLLSVFRFTVAQSRIVAIDLFTDPTRFDEIAIAVLDE